MNKEFTKELTALINRYGLDTECDTPDYIIAEHLESCFEAYKETVKSRDTWFGFKPFALPVIGVE